MRNILPFLLVQVENVFLVVADFLGWLSSDKVTTFAMELGTSLLRVLLVACLFVPFLVVVFW